MQQFTITNNILFQILKPNTREILVDSIIDPIKQITSKLYQSDIQAT